MTDTTNPATCGLANPAVGTTDQTMGRLTGLLSGLIEDQRLAVGTVSQEEMFQGASSRGAIAQVTGAGVPSQRFENELALVRLGVATSLFYALRCKHPPTATHSLRVAIACSAWCQRLRLEDEDRDRIEVAALLHDIGKIGIPDAILKKPAQLSPEEQATMDLCPHLGAEILRGCTGDERLLDIVRLNHVWYEGRAGDNMPHGDALPVGSRMLAIVEAFDAMTTEQIYRPAMSRERALAELAHFAGTQFDPDLARDYHRMLEQNPETLHQGIVERWLNQLRDSADARWNASAIASPEPQSAASAVDGFYHQLMMHTHDGVVFIDRDGVVRAWNIALQQTTGLSDTAICGNQWDPSMIGLGDRRGQAIDRANCPLLKCLAQGGHLNLPLSVRGRKDSRLMVNLRVSGVSGTSTRVDGVVAIFQDASHQARLEKRVQDLNERVTRDPLTGVANRAEFDRTLDHLTDLARAGKGSFSLIIADLDRFKRINDVYGHPAGDEAIISFARIISTHSRDGDSVARYGGEEFVLLCPCCDNATAANRAEAIREALEKATFSFLEEGRITASFGVTEFQDGDTAETVLARADRALLRAKDNGRNRVIQLGSGGFNTRTKVGHWGGGWFSWFERGRGESKSEFRLATPVPIDLVIEKLRGFVADHRAEILQVGRNELDIRLTAVFRVGGRRRSDERVEFHLHILLEERATEHGRAHGNTVPGSQTVLDVSLEPVRGRDRRRSDLKDGVQQVLASLRSYLMAESVPRV